MRGETWLNMCWVASMTLPTLLHIPAVLHSVYVDESRGSRHHYHVWQRTHAALSIRFWLGLLRPRGEGDCHVTQLTHPAVCCAASSQTRGISGWAAQSSLHAIMRCRGGCDCCTLWSWATMFRCDPLNRQYINRSKLQECYIDLLSDLRRSGS